MTITHFPLKKISASLNIRNIEAEFMFPNLIVFEDSKVIHVTSLLPNKNEDEKDQIYKFEQEIVDHGIQDHYLWLLLRSGDIMVIDTVKGIQMKIVNESSASFKIQEIAYISDFVYFTSESGDCFQTLLNCKELQARFEEGLNEILLTIQKAHVRHSYNRKTGLVINGLNIFVEAGTLKVKCPITELVETIITDIQVKHIVCWNDIAVFVDKLGKMWGIDLPESCIIFKSDKKEYKYYPVEAHDDVLYYLIWNNEEVQICCAEVACSSPSKQSGSRISQESQEPSSQDTLKSQLKALTESILSSPKPVSISAQFQTLLETISDLTFLVDTVSTLCQHNIVYKSFLYPLQKRILSINDNDLIKIISDLSIKIDLVEYIHFTGNHYYENINLFERNAVELCIIFISRSDFDIASMCWLKYSQLNQNITSYDIVNILNAISNSTKMSAIIIWLKNFAPSLLEQNPYYIDLFVRWASERVFMLEQSTYWPKIGFKFTEEIISILETSLKCISVRPVSMDDLDSLKTGICYIMELKEKYKINMLLGELSSQSPNEVALIMLRRCYTEDLEAFLQSYLPSYATRHLFDLDDTLYAYIESEATSSGGGIDGARLKILLDTFHSYNNKLECLLQVLKVLDVPWNTAVLELAVSTIAVTVQNFTVSDSERLLAQDIQKELNYANVKVILKKYNFPITCTDYMLVLHKIMSVAMVELNDLKIIMSVIPAYTNYANGLYIQRCLEDCETKTALNYFNSLSFKEKKMLIKIVVGKYDQIMNGSDKNSTIEKNYIDFMKGTQLLCKSEVQDIESLYHFKNSYCLSFNMNNIYSESACEREVNIWICKDGSTASLGRGASIVQLTYANQSQYSVLMTLLRYTSTCHQVRKLVEYLLSMLARRKNISSNKLSPVLSQFKDGQNSHLLVESYSVLIELATKCNEEYLHKLLKIISIFNSLISAGIVVKNLSIVWKFNYIYLPISSSSAVNDLIYFYESSGFSKNVISDISLYHIKCDFTPYRIISFILSNSQDTLQSLDGHVIEITKKLLAKVVAVQDLDYVLMTNLLLMLKNVEEIQGVKISFLEVLRGQNEALPPNVLSYLSLSSVRRTFSFDDAYSKEFGQTVSFPPQYILTSKFNINLAEVALPDSSNETWDVKVILFYVLLQYPDTSFDRLVELCRALNVSINDGLSLQLVSLLSTWELKYKVLNDHLGYRQILIESNEQQLSKCFVIWNSIDNKDILKDILNDFWKNGEINLHGRLVSINPYYYEVFLCIYRLIFAPSVELKNMKEYFLLHFLKDYRRKSSPKQYEFELFSVKGMFPEIGYFRLPFHLFMRDDKWSNLKSEITLDTYERWLPAVVLLSLDSDLQTARDMICSNAVKQTMTTRKRNENVDSHNQHTEPWSLTSHEEPLLRAAHRCVRHIASMEWAGACLFYVLQGCARGADQVAAAHLCYQFAQRWTALQPGSRSVRQMERLYATLSTRHALYKIEWACEEFVRLSAEPVQLIRSLYLHPDFIHKMSRFDVNRAANEIADKNGINISSIRIQILENILDKTNDNKSKNFTTLNVKELMTAKYILKATCPKMGAIYLSRIAFDEESDHNKFKKLRALQCLMSIVDQDTAVKVSNCERDALWTSLLELLSIVNLENIDMPWIAATFAQDHTRALEQLLQAIDGNLDGLKIAAELSYQYGSSQILRSLIPLLLRAGLFEEMIPLLLKLPAQLDNIVISAWRAVILSPFQRADYPLTERHKARCLNAINLLPICPVIKDEDLVEVWKNCIRCKCFGLGCLVLPYMTPQTRQTLTELQKIDRRNLISSLKNLHAETYLVSGAMHVIEKMASKTYHR